ncbi:unnamed protein product [Triticum turgidum subsp. durum]|uniref:PGG domain-containing protein n=1 Tax=Triticum turgidum subsp. durum TaxID=4567 RepID=A0A9R1S990_TRITD|nr:unnamed protein product [Triticum turgidum subsp. durum]
MLTVDELMTADPFLARVPENGTSPLFLAVSLRHEKIVRELYERDKKLSYSGPDGQNALHAAVLRSRGMAEALLNWNKELTKKRDQHGNTPLHFAVSLETGTRGMLPQYAVPVHSRILIQQALISADATLRICRRDIMTKGPSTQSDAEIDAVISNSTQFLGLGLVLITTMAFGAAFALPGGYRADDHLKGGTPTLSTERVFQGFLMANALAFICSSLAVLSLVFAGTPTVEIPMRYVHYNISIWLSFNGVLSLGTAFILAIYIMITPVISGTAIMVMVVFSSLEIIYMPSLVEKLVKFMIVVCGRVGILPVMLRSEMPKVMLLTIWPLIVIFGWQEYAWRHMWHYVPVAEKLVT